MKALRIVGLLGVVLALYSGAAQRVNATSFPVECVYYCSGSQYIAGCNGSPAGCCKTLKRVGCPDPSVFDSGYCTDGTNEQNCLFV